MRIQYFSPRHKYKPVSLTGTWCALNCKFCNRRYLESMVHVTPHNFIDVMRELYSSGVRGVLLSGGFRNDATLPIEAYINAIKVVKKELGLFISAHLGLQTRSEVLRELRGLIDVVDYEFTLSEFIVNYVRGLKLRPSRYVEALKTMLENDLHVVPHVFAWHPAITREALGRELKILNDYGLREVTLLVYIDPHTRYDSEDLASRVLENIEYARSVFPGSIYMGCMRPGYIRPILDKSLVEKGLVDRIANPYHKVLAEYPEEYYDACCSIPINEETRSLFYVGSSLEIVR